MSTTPFAGCVRFIRHPLNKHKWRPNWVPGTRPGTKGAAATKRSTGPCVCNTKPIARPVGKSVYMWDYVELAVDLWYLWLLDTLSIEFQPHVTTDKGHLRVN